MLENYIRLLTGTFLGGFSTLLNIILSADVALENAPFILELIPVIFGGFSAMFTCIYLFYQIKKIRRELKTKNGKTNHPAH